MYRKGVSALILNNKKEFLLVNLNSFEDKYFAIPGGGVEEGESLQDAVYREIKEELGIDRDSLELIGKSDSPLRVTFKTPKIKNGVEIIGSERYFFGFNFIGDNNEIKLQEEEVRAYKWVSFSDLGKYLLFDDQLEESVGKIGDIFPRFGK
jgi:putative (di)nucleoside polyphosphate hydrolase